MNKGYIKIALALLSVAGYMQNIAFAIEHAAATTSSNEKFEQLSLRVKQAKEAQQAKEAEEAKEAAYVMDEALNIAKKHAEDLDGYELYYEKNKGTRLYFKRVNNTDVGRLDLIIPRPNSYDTVVDILWDLNGEKKFDDSFVEGLTSKIYGLDFIIRQKRYKSGTGSWKSYYHALAKKVELSEGETAIVFVSSNMNDHDGGENSEYVNPIVESANTFKPDIDSQRDIRNGELSKMYVNISAFFIYNNCCCTRITHIISMDHNTLPDTTEETLRVMTAQKMLNVANLRDVLTRNMPTIHIIH
ncbi:fam-a protein [Plasmodium chabaudi adami]|uniref:Fam-a protein n=1 Tax=Plasmodium chabaudi adami TaxID=5826 RepID=A0A1D3L9V9_PLACE|nr:fam-a protein [Plasmodium chabaudi adami]